MKKGEEGFLEQAVITQKKIEEFLEKLQSDGKDCHILAEYSRNLNRLYEKAKENGCLLNKEILERWRMEQVREGAASGTITNRTVKINQFLRYLGLEDLCFPSGKRQDLRGKQFGSLMAIEPTEKRSADRSIYWRCRCLACGKEKEIPANQLKKGVQVSCGCKRASQLQETNGYVEGTCLKNVFSNKINKNNTSGYRGVYQKRGKWAAQIQYKKKIYYLGSYDRLEDAIRARKTAENQVRDDAEKLLEKTEETREEKTMVSGKDIYET